MRKTLWTLSLMMTLALSTGCSPSQSEGYAAGLLDSAAPLVKPHAGALASGNARDARETGARLIAVLCQWKDTCK